MGPSLKALELDRVLALLAAYARSDPGRRHILATLPRFSAGEGSRFFSLAQDMSRFLAASGTLGLDTLAAGELLEDPTAGRDSATLTALLGLVRLVVDTRRQLVGGTAAESPLGQLAHSLPQLEGLLAFGEQRITADGEIPDTASAVLAQARAARERLRRDIVAALERIRRGNTDLSAPFTLRRDRYCLPVPVGAKSQIPGLLLDASGSGATVFVEPFGVVELNNDLAQATARVREEEERILAELAAAFARHREPLQQASHALATVDALQARVLFGRDFGGVLLEPGGGRSLALRGGRHPLLDPALAGIRREVLGEAGNTKPVVPLDVELTDQARVILLSGPNAGGKTVAVKTIGLAALMAQLGIPVLADEGSILPPVSGLWCHIGDEQNLLSDLSTFTGAMHATVRLLTDADENTLVLYDELGSGTDPEEGAALAVALLEELIRRRCWTVATAHLVTVAAHIESLPGAGNAAMGFDDGSGRPTYRLHQGLPGRSRGLAIAQGCGLPGTILDRARSLLTDAYLAIDAYLARLQEERERLRHERDQAAAARRRLEQQSRETTAAGERLEEERRVVKGRLQEERDRLRRVARERLGSVLAELEAARAAGDLPGRRRQAALRRNAMPPEEEPGEANGRAEADEVPFPGATVRLKGLGTTGEVGRVAGGRLEVNVEGKRVWVESRECELVTPAPRPDPALTVAGESSPEAVSEVKLLGLTREEAWDELERFLDTSLLHGVRRVRIVHGHGSGALRRMVRELLRGFPGVAHSSHPPQHRGGTGVTEVELESR